MNMPDMQKFTAGKHAIKTTGTQVYGICLLAGPLCSELHAQVQATELQSQCTKHTFMKCKIVTDAEVRILT